MSDAVVLDSTPLGILCHPRNPPPVMACRQWIDDLLAANRRVILPEIADYEVRRELIRRNSRIALANLDLRLEYVPLTTAAIRELGARPGLSARWRGCGLHRRSLLSGKRGAYGPSPAAV